MIKRLVIKINSTNITIIEEKRIKNTIKINKIVKAETPKHSFENGSIQNSDSIAKAIEKCLKDNKIRTDKAIFIINSSSIITRIAKLPYVTGINDSLSMIKFELEQSMPIDINQYNFIYKIINKYKEGNTEKAEYVINAIPKEICESYTAVAEKAGLKAEAIDLSFNNFEILDETSTMINEKNNISNKIIGFLNMDVDTTIFSVMNNGANDFSRVIDKSLISFENDLAHRFNMSSQEIEKYFEDIDISDSEMPYNEQENTKLTSLRVTMEVCVEEVNRYIKYYSSKNKGASLSKIYIYGRYSKLRNIDKYLSTILGIPVEIIKNISIINCPQNLKAELQDNIENVLGIFSGKGKLQFLTINKRIQKKHVNVSVAALIVFVPLVLFILIYGYKYYSDYTFYKDEIKKMNSYMENENTKRIAEEVIDLNSKMDEINKYAAVAEQAAKVINAEDIIKVDLFKDISAATPDDTSVQSMQIGGEDGRIKVYIQCSSVALSSVAQFEKNIKDLGYVQSSYITTVSNGDKYTYVIICELKGVNDNEAE